MEVGKLFENHPPSNEDQSGNKGSPFKKGVGPICDCMGCLYVGHMRTGGELRAKTTRRGKADKQQSCRQLLKPFKLVTDSSQ